MKYQNESRLQLRKKTENINIIAQVEKYNICVVVLNPNNVYNE